MTSFIVTSYNFEQKLMLHRALPTWEIVRSVASLYLECCDCQPLPLFHGATFINSLPGRDPEVLFSILALALRFSTDEAILRDCDELCRNYAEAARRLVMARISDGPIELSTLQSLCLLSLVDFTSMAECYKSLPCT